MTRASFLGLGHLSKRTIPNYFLHINALYYFQYLELFCHHNPESDNLQDCWLGKDSDGKQDIPLFFLNFFYLGSHILIAVQMKIHKSLKAWK